MRAKLIKESMYANENLEFAQRMYTLEDELKKLNPEAWSDFKTDSAGLWHYLDVEDWEEAFSKDPMSSLGFEEELRSLISMSK